MSSPSAFESVGREGQGYADNDVATSSYSTLGADDERNPLVGSQVGPTGSEDSLRILEDSEDEEVGINVDFVGEWDGRCKNWPIVAGYDWVPHEVKLYASSFCTGRSIKELLSRISLVKATVDADYFKIAVY
ncbi:hypothetical protein V8G54_031979 [Vigna mungo]|uniref:Uncharacterized protein n=1 Tax=Vigna mungo TaxID=3915 RepID=A0AAQ3RGA2_VIGMU